MKVREWMSPDPVTVTPDTTVAETRRELEVHGFRHVPVIEDGQLVGIVSDRDVRISAEALRAALRHGDVDLLLDADNPVESVMSTQPHVIDQDASMSEATRLLVSRRVSALPVVDADHGLVGIITAVDCLLATLQNATADT